MALINPYIHFNGNAEEAFTFYKTVFGGELSKFGVQWMVDYDPKK